MLTNRMNNSNLNMIKWQSLVIKVYHNFDSGQNCEALSVKYLHRCRRWLICTNVCFFLGCFFKISCSTKKKGCFILTLCTGCILLFYFIFFYFWVSFSWKQVSEGGRYMCGSCSSGTRSLLDDALQLTAPKRPESVSYPDLKCVLQWEVFI